MSEIPTEDITGQPELSPEEMTMLESYNTQDEEGGSQ